MADYKQVVECALSQVGYEEPHHDNHQKYGYDIDHLWPTWYNGKKDGYDWCTQFVDWCFLTTYGYEKAKELLCRPNKNLGAVVKHAYNYFKEKGQVGTVPKLGAVIYFQNSKGLSHTGIVVGFDNTKVYTVEGNSGKGNYFVTKDWYTRTNNYIYGYGYPAYDGVKPSDDYVAGNIYKVICKEPLNVRKDATTSSEAFGQLTKGTQVLCETTKKDSSGNTWMKITGWIAAKYDNDKYVG